MVKQTTYNVLNIVIAFAVTMFFSYAFKKVIRNALIKICSLGVISIMLISCKNNFKEIQKIGVSDNEPIGVAEDINLKHTDSGKIKAILVSPKMFDYSNRKFPYNEFTEGVNLEIYENDKKSVVISDYAIIYNKTNIIDLRGNVKIATHSNDTLFADQLFYDQDKEWLFTNKPVSFRTGNDLIHGNGFDSDSKFTNAEVLEINGIITLNE